MLRALYMICAIFMAYVSVRTFQDGSSDFFMLCFAFYIFLFSILICCFEAQLFGFISSMIAINFGFMYNIIGRWIFLIFVGVMCMKLGPFGVACMITLYVGGLGHAIMIFKFPFFQEYQRMLHFDMNNKA